LDSKFTNPYFFCFILIWIYLRHYLNLRILYSVLTEFRTIGPYTLDWNTQQYKFWVSQWIAFTLLAALQVMNLFWLFLILRVAYTALVTNVTKDVRSDDEDSVTEDAPQLQSAVQKIDPASTSHGHAKGWNATTSGAENGAGWVSGGEQLVNGSAEAQGSTGLQRRSPRHELVQQGSS
jgi:very-long-chain ceramide synthase